MSNSSVSSLLPVQDGSLKAAWVPGQIGGVIPDISGQSKNGTPTSNPGPSFENDPFFGRVMRCAGNESGFTFPATLSVTTAATWGVWYKVPTLTLTGAGDFSTLFGANTDNGYLGLSQTAHAHPFATLVISGTPRTLTAAIDSRIGVWMFYVCTYDGDKIRIYADGVLGNTSLSYPGTIESWSAGTGKIGKLILLLYSFNGWLKSPFIMNRALNQDEITALYNQGKMALYKSDYGAIVSLADGGGVANQQISNTQFFTGDSTSRWRIETETINGKSTKVLTCKTAGTVYVDRSVLQSEAGALAFGEWEWWNYRASAASLAVGLFTDRIGAYGASGMTGWFFDRPSATTWQMIRVVAGVVTVPSWTTTPAFTASTWHKTTIKRSVAGVWSMYANDMLLSTVGGAGTNPFTDATNLTGNYITISFGVGDKISLGAIDGSNSFVKRIKG